MDVCVGRVFAEWAMEQLITDCNFHPNVMFNDKDLFYMHGFRKISIYQSKCNLRAPHVFRKSYKNVVKITFI